MKKTIVMMAAMMLMAGGMACAQQPEKQDSTKQEAPVNPTPAEEKSEPAKEEKSEPAKDEKTDGKGECSKGECGQNADATPAAK